MERMKLYLKPFTFLPAILIIYLIFGFSSQNGYQSSELSYKISHEVVETASDVLQKNYTPEQIEYYTNKIHTPVRKVAHMTEYFLLALSVIIPLRLYKLRRFWLTLVTFLLCFAVACSDEYHQSFVDGRDGSQLDVIIDSIGVLLGIFSVKFMSFIGRHAFRKSSKDTESPPAQAYSYEQQSVYVYEETPPYEQQPPYDYDRTAPYDRRAPYDYNEISPYDYDEMPPYDCDEMPPYEQPPPYDYDEIPPHERRPHSSDHLSEDLSIKNLIRNLRDKDK